MTDPGLTDRLRQKSRRAGLAVGLSMALTIAICIGGATVIYAALVEPLSQFIPIPAPQQIAPQQGNASSGGLSDVPAVDAPAAPAQPDQGIAAAPTEVPPEPTTAPEPEPEQEPSPTATSEAFDPTHQIRGDQAVNLRTEPSRSDSGVIRALQPSTPLQFMDEEAPTENPVEDGDVWMLFRTSDGEEGWVREIDVSTYTP
jgi:hypothetical protein